MPYKTVPTYRHRVLRVQLFIEEHLDEELSLERLAQVAQVSPFHFHRIFKGIVGEGVAEHVRRLRLESAAIQLQISSRPVIEIALDAGYGSHEAFTRSFRRHFSVSPTEFRRQEKFILSRREPCILSLPLQSEEVVVVTLAPKRVAYLRHVGPYLECGPTFEKIFAWGASEEHMGPQTECIGIGHDNPDLTDADKLRMDCCLSVPDGFAGQDEIQAQTIEGGDYALLRYKGPHEKLDEAYRWLFGEWLSASGRELRDQPPFEIYQNSPQETVPEELLTDIHLPLKSRILEELVAPFPAKMARL